MPWIVLVLVCGMVFSACECSPPSGAEPVKEVTAEGSKESGRPEETESPRPEEAEATETKPEPAEASGGETPDKPDASESLPESPTEKAPEARLRLMVVSRAEDSVPPKFTKLEISPDPVQAGQSLSVAVTPDTDLSDVVAAQISLQSPNQKHSLYLSLQYHPAQKRFVGQASIPLYVEGGEWTINRLTLQDGAGNPGVYLGSQPPLQGIKFTILSPKADTTPPKLLSFQILASQAKAGDALPFALTAEDPAPATGMRQISVFAASTIGGGSASAFALFNPLQSRYEGSLRIPKEGGDGEWKITQISLQDHAENTSFVPSSDPLLASATFTVTGSSPPLPPPTDTLPPVFKAASLSPSQILDGQTFRLLVEADDPGGAGIARLQATFADPRGADRFTLDLQYNPARDLYEAAGRIALFSLSGSWGISSLQATDRAGNTAILRGSDLQTLPPLDPSRLEAALEHLRIAVSPAADQDLQAPELTGFHLAPGETTQGGSIRVYVRLRDPGGSGLASASCTFQSPISDLRRQVILALNSDTAFYEGSLAIAPNDPPGAWWVSGCFLSDQAGNTAPISPIALSKLAPLDISQATSNPSPDPFVFTLKPRLPQPPPDDLPPQMKAFQISASSVAPGQALRLFVQAEDSGGSGIDRGSCEFVALSPASSGSSAAFVSLTFHPGRLFFEGEIAIPLDASPGLWTIQACQWKDKAGNSTLLLPTDTAKLPALDLSNLWPSAPSEHRAFTVGSPPPPSTDTQAPTFGRLRVYPDQAISNQRSRLFVEISDNVAVTSAFCSFKPAVEEPPVTPYASAVLRFNPATGLWEGDVTIYPLAQKGVWSLSRCQAEDRAGNRTILSESQARVAPPLPTSAFLPPSLSKTLSLTITPPSGPLDTTPPQITSLRFLPDQASAGTSVVLQAEGSDDSSGVSGISVNLQSPQGKVSLFPFLQAVPSLGLWEAEIEIPPSGEDGAWTISSATIFDRAENRTTLNSASPLLSSLSLTVSGSKPPADQTPPVLLSLRLGRAVALAGESVRIYAGITDTESGVRSASLSLRSPTGKAQTSAFLSFNPATGLWEGEAPIPLAGEDGLWTATALQATDQAGNSSLLDAQAPFLQSLRLTIRQTPTPSDTEAPQIRQIMIRATTAAAGSSISILADITDDKSGPAAASLILTSPASQVPLSVALSLSPASRLWEASLAIPPTTSPGLWSISQISLRDKAGNTRILTSSDPFLQSP